MPARGAGAGGRERRRDRDVEARVRVGAELETGVAHREPLALVGDGLAAEKRHHHVERLFHPRALRVGRDSQHVRVRGELAGADAEHRPAPGEVVEQDHPIRQHERMVVRERAHAGAEADLLRALRGHADEHLGRGDDLVPRRVVLTDPRLVEAPPVEVHDQVEVALDRQRRVLTDGVERGHEGSEAHRAIRTVRARVGQVRTGGDLTAAATRSSGRASGPLSRLVISA